MHLAGESGIFPTLEYSCVAVALADRSVLHLNDLGARCSRTEGRFRFLHIDFWTSSLPLNRPSTPEAVRLENRPENADMSNQFIPFTM